jgi:hypothetical protein
LRRRSRPRGRRSQVGLCALGALALAACGRASPPPAEDPTKTPSETRALYLREAETPAAAKAGTAIEVLVRGDLPNPGWKFLRWEIREDEDAEPRAWIVTPLIVNTLAPGEMVTQITVPFEGVARFDAPAVPGRIAVEARGFTPDETIRREVEVVAPSTFLVMTVTGGFAGVTERVTVMEDGAIAASRSMDGASATGRLTIAEMAAIRAARDSADIQALEPVSLAENAADVFTYEVVDFAWTPPVRVVADDVAMPVALQPLTRLLREKSEALLGPVRQ